MKTDWHDKITTVFFPKRCVCCATVIHPNETVCENCDVEEYRIPFPKCDRCGQETARCNCVWDEFRFDRIITPFYYTDGIKKCITNFKFKGYVDNGKFLADEMVKAFEQEYVYDLPDMIVSVPLTKKRKRRRGFSQTDVLAQRISYKTGIEFKKDLLIKIRETRPQVGLDAKERKENLIGAFAVAEGADLKGKTVIVCDDNKTTGATLHECAKALKKAGAKNVIALTAALTKNDFRGEPN